APAELLKSEERVCKQRFEAHLHEELIGLQSGCHQSLEPIARGNGSRATATERRQFRIERGSDQTPFGRRVRVRQAAAHRATRANRVMRDVTDDSSEQGAQRTGFDRAFKCGMAHACAYAKVPVVANR